MTKELIRINISSQIRTSGFLGWAYRTIELSRGGEAPFEDLDDRDALYGQAQEGDHVRIVAESPRWGTPHPYHAEHGPLELVVGDKP